MSPSDVNNADLATISAQSDQRTRSLVLEQYLTTSQALARSM